MKIETIITLLILIITIWVFFKYSWTFYLFLVIIGLSIFYIFFIKKYNELERGIIFRMGKFNRIVGPGWSVVIPFFEKEYAKIDARTHMIDITINEAFTNDDLRLSINGLFYYKISDPEKAILKIDNYEKGIKNLIISEVRDTIASLTMREVFSKLDVLDDLVLDKIKNNSWKFGIDVSMIQLKSVTPPVEIVQAMEGKEIAMQELQAQRFKAEAKKVIINALGSAKNLDDKAIMYIYIEALKSLGSSKSSKILFPAQFMNILGGIGNNIIKNNRGLDIASAIDKVKDSILNNK